MTDAIAFTCLDRGDDSPAKRSVIDWRELPCLLVSVRRGLHWKLLLDHGVSHTFGPGEVMIIPPRTRHRIEILSRTKVTGTRWAHIRYTVAGGIELFPLMTLPLSAGAHIGKKIGDIVSELAQLSPDAIADRAREQELGFRILGILLSLVRRDPKQTRSLREAMRLAPAFRYIEEHLAENISPSDAADTVGLSPSRFTVLFKAAAGKPLMDHIREARIARVKMMLLSGGTLSSAARAAGYTTSFSLSRAFKTAVGISPASYIRANQDLR
ncbi:MAG: AraC family transcriptional regulator [Spirochaetota bacterium]